MFNILSIHFAVNSCVKGSMEQQHLGEIILQNNVAALIDEIVSTQCSVHVQ